jgi:glycosyltransferase involved in cell wall biosynthesis
MRVWVLTCTGGRPEAFELCKKYMERQSFQDFTWVVVDDCIPQMEAVPADIVIRPTLPWKPGDQTVIRNAREGLRVIQNNCEPTDIVVFVEDDDWYHPSYLEAMLSPIDRPEVEIWGEGWTIYYNVVCRRYHAHHNSDRASLCATAMRGSFIPEAIDVADRMMGSGKFTYDIELFKAAGERKIIMNSNLCVGIKGLPGRPGCTSGHRYNVPAAYKYDLDAEALMTWLGEDSREYLGYFRPPQPPKPIPKRPVTREPARPRRTRKGSAKVSSTVITQINKGKK